ncbi:hypothetical protein PRZ48_009284 [Zasmidium cellare]|uniref:Rhodopsin domain-containing protein n=1 Tax=Zasmidium cellare TaxID=395010 RepID=A0ABR0EBA1_ZASCE|nr:hypothetical protein PRZ48_009284 [Zasmidium cellare]
MYLDLTPRAFTDPSESDHSVYIGITAILLVCFTTLTLAVRIWVRWGKYSWDDASVFLAQILAYGQFATVIASLVLGLGKKWSDIPQASQNNIATNLTAAKILYILVLGFLKMGVTWPIRRLFKRMGKRVPVIACTVLMGTEAVWSLAAIIVLSIGCPPNSILPGTVPRNSCAFGAARWGVVVIVDIVQELGIASMSMVLLSMLKRKISKEEKLTSMLAFALRPGIIVFAVLAYIARVATIETRYLPENTGHALQYTWVQIWQEVQLTYSMFTATLPFVLGFMRNFDTNTNNRSSMSAAMILGASKLTSRAGTAHSRQPPTFAGQMERRGTADSRPGVMPSMPDDVHKWDQPVKYSVKIYSADDDQSIDRSVANPSEEMIAGIRRNDVITVRDEEKA